MKNNSQPNHQAVPRWAQRLLTWLHPENTLEEVEGDLEELYNYWYQRAGKTQATLRYLLNVLSVLPPFVRKRQRKEAYYQPSISHFDMIRNFFKIALRNLNKNRSYTILNITGLTLGLVCFAFIALWVSDEWSYDRFNEKADRIYRVVGTVASETETFEHAVSSVPLAPALKNDCPEIENYVRLDLNNAIVKYNNQRFSEEGFLAADASFFEMFSYKLTQGDAHTALRDPYSLVLTQSIADKYFGSENPLGKTLAIQLYDSTGHGIPYKITGIMPDAPKNAHFTFNFITSFETLIASNRQEFMSLDAWGDESYYTYLLLKAGVKENDVAKKVDLLYTKYLEPLMRRSAGNGGTPTKYSIQLQSLTDIYLKSHRRYEISATGSRTNLSIFSLIGIFILLLAAINYINLATARSLQRAKEVGIKKVMGAVKGQLISQYLFESCLLTAISFILAIGLSYLLQPTFHLITAKDISLYHSSRLMGFMVGVSLLLGILAGLYPAFIISSYKPISILKGSFTSSTKGTRLRQALVVLQFTVTITLLASIFIIKSQMAFIKNKDLGYNKAALLTLKVNGDKDVLKKIESFRQDILLNSLIKGVTTSNSILVGGMGNNGIQTVNNQGKSLAANNYRLMIDYDFLSVMDIKLIAGRNFSHNFPSDVRTDSTQNYILNEAAIRAFGWKDSESAIGKPFAMSGRRGTVVGVVKDFHFNSLQHKVEPLAMLLHNGNFARIIVKIDMQQSQASLALIENEWKKHFPESYLAYEFQDTKLNDQYLAENRFTNIFFYFSLISVLIACLGLYGLTLFTTQQRTKEIGIRKVLGATVGSIITSLSQDFLKLVLVAILIASPIAWYFMNQWLQTFAYKIIIEWWIFVLAGLLAVLIALITVSFQSIKAALMNPVKTLRSE